MYSNTTDVRAHSPKNGICPRAKLSSQKITPNYPASNLLKHVEASFFPCFPHLWTAIYPPWRLPELQSSPTTWPRMAQSSMVSSFYTDHITIQNQNMVYNCINRWYLYIYVYIIYIYNIYIYYIYYIIYYIYYIYIYIIYIYYIYYIYIIYILALSLSLSLSLSSAWVLCGYLLRFARITHQNWWFKVVHFLTILKIGRYSSNIVENSLQIQMIRKLWANVPPNNEIHHGTPNVHGLSCSLLEWSI